MPEDDKKRLDEAYNTEAVQYVLTVLGIYIDNKVEGQQNTSDALEKYNMASWPYMQADSVGFRRALRNLKTILLFNRD